MKQERILPSPLQQSSSVNDLIKEIVSDCADAWRLPQNAILAILTAPFIIALTGLIAALIGKGVYKWLIHEDSIVENLQVLFYALALVFGILVVKQLWQSGHKAFAILYIGLCLGFVFLIGDEISWGQRIFGWQTGAALKAINRQGETNLHNIKGVEELFRWAELLIGVYGTLVPLILLTPYFPAQFRKPASWLVPHYSLVPYFFLLLSWRLIHNVFKLTQSHPYAADEYTEIIELILAIGFFLFLVYQSRQFNKVDRN
jgi:hypothetical protein